jgi:hypothetical protein
LRRSKSIRQGSGKQLEKRKTEFEDRRSASRRKRKRTGMIIDPLTKKNSER